MKNKVKITPIQGPYNIMPILPPNLGSYATDYAAYLRAYKLYVNAVLEQRKFMNTLSKAREAARPKKKASDQGFEKLLKDRIEKAKKEIIVETTEYTTKPKVVPGKLVDRVKTEWVCQGTGKHTSPFYVSYCKATSERDGLCGAFLNKEPRKTLVKELSDPTIIEEKIPVKVQKKQIINPTDEEVEKIKHDLRHERAVEKRRRWRINKAKRARENVKEEIAKFGNVSNSSDKKPKNSFQDENCGEIKRENKSRDSVEDQSWTEVKRKNKLKPKISKPVEIVYESIKHAREITQLRLMKADERITTFAKAHNVSKLNVVGPDGRKTNGPWDDQRFVKWQDMINNWSSNQSKILNELPDKINFTCRKLRPFRDPIISNLC